MRTAPRVCHIVIALAPGGLEQLVVTWTNARNRAHPGSTCIVCLDQAGELASAVDGAAVSVLGARRWRFLWDRAAVRRLREDLRAQLPTGPIDVIHSHNLAAQQYAALAVRGGNVGHVHTEHGSNIHTSGLKNRLRHRVLARVSDRVVAVSEDTARAMAPVWGLGPERLTVIPNGVSAAPAVGEAELHALRHELDLPADALVLGGVGRLAVVKGYDRLLAVLPSLVPLLPRLMVVLVGDGPERAALESQAQQLGVRSRVRFAGFRRDARRFFPLFDCYVAPSRSEGLPVALLEAMAAGCPALVTDVGEQRAVIDNGAAGTLLPREDRRWAETILDILGERGRLEARRRAEVARERVRTQYSLEATMAAYERLYEALAPASR